MVDPAIRLLGSYLPKGFENLWPHKAALFMNAKFWKQPRCPSVGEWLNELVHPDDGILFSDKEK